MISIKEEKPPVTYFQMEFNITAISKWVKDKKDIPPVRNRDWDSLDVTKKHLITLLPLDPFLFYHNDINSFSPAIAGLERIENGDIYSIEWGMTQTEFYVLVNAEGLVFLAPLDEIVFLLANRSPKSISGNALEDMEGGIIDINAENEYCRQIYKNSVYGAGVEFSNSLVHFSAVYATESNIELYKFD